MTEMERIDQAFFKIAETLTKAWEEIVETITWAWDKFADWFYPHFWRNHIVMAVVFIVLIIVAKR